LRAPSSCWRRRHGYGARPDTTLAWAANGQALFERMEGDRTNVQGLPMALLVRLLRKTGVTFFAPRR